MKNTVVFGAIIAGLMPGIGMAAEYVYQPFTVAGGSNVAVAAVNDSGVAVGNYVSPTTGTMGFVGRAGEIITLPPAKSNPGTTGGGVPHPLGINKSGVVIGYDPLGDDGSGFLAVTFFVWQNSAYTYLAGTNNFASGAYIGRDSRLCYSGFDGARSPTISFVGVPGRQQSFTNPPGLNGNVSLASINGAGIEAGVYTKFPYYAADNVVFTAKGATPASLTRILPPGAVASFGGWINDSNQVAGSYLDANQVTHGFLFTNGSFATFDMPGPADGMDTFGIDESGRVVGTYYKGKVTHSFVYSAGSVTTLLSFGGNENVRIFISKLGRHISITETDPSGGAKSWLA